MSRAAAVAALALTISCAPAPIAPTPTLEGFDWLTGCWLSRDGTVEQWASESASAIAATGLFPQSDGTQVSQSLRIEAQDDGTVTLVASIAGDEPRAYTLAARSAHEAMFENATNEGPKRVSYRRDGERLTITLSESLEVGQPGFETHYEACDSALIAP